MTTRTPRKKIATGLCGLLLSLFLLALFRMVLTAPPAVDPDHPFDTQATMERLARILGDEAPHPVDSDESDAVIKRLLSEIRALGFTPEVDDAFHCSTGMLILVILNTPGDLAAPDADFNDFARCQRHDLGALLGYGSDRAGRIEQARQDMLAVETHRGMARVKSPA